MGFTTRCSFCYTALDLEGTTLEVMWSCVPERNGHEATRRCRPQPGRR
jgi:hypothetical protein